MEPVRAWISGFFASIGLLPSLVAGGFHVPTPEAARELIGLEVRMEDGHSLKRAEDDPIPVEIEFSKEVEVNDCELVIRNAGLRIGTVSVDLLEQESKLRKDYRFVGYAFRLSPAALAESYLRAQVRREGQSRCFLVPLLRFIPDRHIDEDVRKASPDYRDEVSALFTNTYQVSPQFIHPGKGRPSNAAGPDPKGGGKESSNVFPLARRPSAQEILEAEGVTFPAGSAVFGGAGSLLNVRNTEDNLRLVERALQKLNR